MNRHMRTSARIAALAALAAGAFGCGGGKLDNATVGGTVKFQERPITGGQVTLFRSAHGVGASAPLGPDGAFKVEGPLRTGSYVVTIRPPAAPADQGPHGPEKYRNERTSDLKVDVAAGDNRFDLVLRP